MDKADSTADVLGKNVRALRTMKGLTQEALAEASKTSRPTIANIEGGKYESVRTSTLERIAEALGVDAGALLTDRPLRRSS